MSSLSVAVNSGFRVLSPLRPAADQAGRPTRRAKELVMSALPNNMYPYGMIYTASGEGLLSVFAHTPTRPRLLQHCFTYSRRSWNTFSTTPPTPPHPTTTTTYACVPLTPSEVTPPPIITKHRPDRICHNKGTGCAGAGHAVFVRV